MIILGFSAPAFAQETGPQTASLPDRLAALGETLEAAATALLEPDAPVAEDLAEPAGPGAGCVAGAEFGSTECGENSTTGPAEYATALGADSTATGDGSVAVGYGSEATGDGSVAVGVFALAADEGSTALGADAWALGFGSTAVGAASTAAAPFSTAVGFGASACGEASAALGAGAAACVDRTTALGAFSTAISEGSTAVGSFAVSLGLGSTAIGGDVNDNGIGAVAFGDYSAAIGGDAIASGNNATAIGGAAAAEGARATAVGAFSFAGANGATSIGFGSIASGSGATAMGDSSLAVGNNSVAIGRRSEASGGGATASGAFSLASGSLSSAFGRNSMATGNYSAAFGASSSATASRALALGGLARADHRDSVAIGYGAQTSFANQILIGLSTSFYTMPGLVAPANQVGSAEFFVVADNAGNLKSLAISALGYGALASTPAQNAEVASLRVQVAAQSAEITAMRAEFAALRAQLLGEAGTAGEVGGDAGGQRRTATASPRDDAGGEDLTGGRIGAHETEGARTGGVLTRTAWNPRAGRDALALQNDGFFALADDVAQLQTDLGALQTTVWRQNDQISVNTDGVAVALAMAGVTGLESGETFALSANWGFFDDRHAFAFSGAARISERFSLNAGLGLGTKTGELGARAGLRWGW